MLAPADRSWGWVVIAVDVKLVQIVVYEGGAFGCRSHPQAHTLFLMAVMGARGEGREEEWPTLFLTLTLTILRMGRVLLCSSIFTRKCGLK